MQALDSIVAAHKKQEQITVGERHDETGMLNPIPYLTGTHDGTVSKSRWYVRPNQQA